MKMNLERLSFILKHNRRRNPDKPVKITETGTVIGGPGFGYEFDGTKLVRFNHYGGVVIGKGVEIHANSTIDRATLPGEFTEIGEGTKIDNLVHIAHNCKVGKHNLICSGAILCGGVQTGDLVFIGVGAMIKQKVIIGKNATIGMGAVVLKNVPDNAIVAGNPAKVIGYENAD